MPICCYFTTLLSRSSYEYEIACVTRSPSTWLFMVPYHSIKLLYSIRRSGAGTFTWKSSGSNKCERVPIPYSLQRHRCRHKWTLLSGCKNQLYPKLWYFYILYTDRDVWKLTNLQLLWETIDSYLQVLWGANIFYTYRDDCYWPTRSPLFIHSDGVTHTCISIHIHQWFR